MIREANPQDVDFITNIASRLARTQFPELRFNRKNTKQIISDAISSPQCKVLVSYGDEPSGALVSVCNDGVWFERKVSSLSLVYSEIPGDGLKMLRIWKRFALSRPAFKVIEVGFPARGDLARLLQRIGLVAQGFHLATMR